MNNLHYAIIFLSIFIIFNFLLRRSLSEPIMLHALIWLIIFIVGYNVYAEFYPLGSFFWKSWMLWFGAFSFGYYLFNFRKNRRKIRVKFYRPLPNYSLFIYMISIIFLGLTIYQGLTGPYGSFIMNLRLSFIFKTNIILQPFFFLFTLLWPLLLYEGVVYQNKKNLMALIVYMLVYTLASGGKFGLLMTFAALLLIFNHREPIKKTQSIIYGSIGLSLIIFLGALRGGGTESLFAYTYAPLVAYETIENTFNKYFGYETFRFFYSAFYSLGITKLTPPEDFYEYVMTPTYVNVYTAFRPFYSDFGLSGVFMGGMAYGMFYGFTYKGYLKGKLLSSGLYMGYAFAIISVPFSDLLFLNLSLIFRTILVFILIYIFINYKTAR